MKPIVKRTLYIIATIGMLCCAKPISKEVTKNYNKCIAYMTTNIVSRS